MQDKTFELVTQEHYFRSEGRRHRYVPVGATVADLVNLSGIPEPFHSDLTVVISKGVEATSVPSSHWSRVRSGENAHVHIYPAVNGPVAGPILSAVLPGVASTLAGALFTSAFAIKVATVAFTIIGALAINALIPPPSVPEAPKDDDPNFTITGLSNAETRYGVYPTVLGRHQMFPPKTARGYTEGARFAHPGFKQSVQRGKGMTILPSFVSDEASCSPSSSASTSVRSHDCPLKAGRPTPSDLMTLLEYRDRRRLHWKTV